ncbi:hypothetical protein JCM6882_005928 [Rhodosporidiobolus microsporus]
MAGPRKSTSSSAAKRAKEDEHGEVVIEEPPADTLPPMPCTAVIGKAAFDQVIRIPLGEIDSTVATQSARRRLSGRPFAMDWTFEYRVKCADSSGAGVFFELRSTTTNKELKFSDMAGLATIFDVSKAGFRPKRAAGNCYMTQDEDGMYTRRTVVFDRPAKGQFELELVFNVSLSSERELRAVLPGALDLAKRVSTLATSPYPHNVRLVFPRSTGNLYLYANRDLLSSSSSYFKVLFASDFAEASPARPAKRVRVADGETPDYEDSDDESDEVYAGKLETPTSADKDDFAAAFHEITVTETAYSTYRAVLLYLQSGYIDFAPLRSASLPLNPKATTTRSEAVAAAAGEDDTLPLPPSPKSVYRLAHFLGLEDLQTLALERIKASLEIETAALELLTPLSLAYDEVQKVLIDYATKNIVAVEQTEAYKAMMAEIEGGGRPDAGPVLVKLLRAQRAGRYY